ncbi:S-adenosyl-L-methionine-dependent methyltransferase [Diplogelasinospora grovesii]|uniref:S-adenosyl-L-methionine-dependent methyltransferase n=1 Tax=Diplogelasinospora grovesii TaxID=303347 RepID=A0AAN6S5M3_9PEZI|nr:S-adenosyl-L-methionine-dependent methyltransferase [Diplogelasinospora grovesii]
MNTVAGSSSSSSLFVAVASAAVNNNPPTEATPSEETKTEKATETNITTKTGAREASIGMATRAETLSLLEVDSAQGDNDMGDGDSGIADIDSSTLSSSVRSSVYEFIEENGRTYHRYKEGQYFLPNDESERERLDLQHQLFLLTFQDQLHLSPTTEEQLHNVLDIGTGTGIWAIDFALRNPSAHVIGTDLSPIQPSHTPANCQFIIEDAQDPWIFPSHQTFSLIHGRALASCFTRPQDVLTSAAGHLTPGTGWLEFQDIVIPMRCIDDSWEGTALQRWNHLMVDCIQRTGRDISYSQRYKEMFRLAGLVDVHDRHFVWPTNRWCRGEEYKRIATWFLKDMSDGLEAISLQILSRIAGMSRDEIDVFLDEVRKDLANPEYHVYIPVTVTMGRRLA